MKDLIIDYTNENMERCHIEYDDILDFLDDMESDKIDIPMLDYSDVSAMLFENKYNQYQCATINDLVNHLNEILK